MHLILDYITFSNTVEIAKYFGTTILHLCEMPSMFSQTIRDVEHFISFPLMLQLQLILQFKMELMMKLMLRV